MSPRQGIEPWSPAWQAGILTTILSRISGDDDSIRAKGTILDSRFKNYGLNRDSNPGPLAPKARIIPLDHWAAYEVVSHEIAILNAPLYTPLKSLILLELFVYSLKLSLWYLSRVAQRKRAGPITQRSVDRNHPLLHTNFELLVLLPNHNTKD